MEQAAFCRSHVVDCSRVGQLGDAWLMPCPAACAHLPRSEVLGASKLRATATYPFVPLLKVRSGWVGAMNQVDYEPAVPGSKTSHMTVAAHSILAWFSPWQVIHRAPPQYVYGSRC